MKTIDFLRELLPGHGVYYAAHGGDGSFRAAPCKTVEDVAHTLKEWNNIGDELYVALGGFKDDSGRQADKAVAFGCMWLDLDCGEGKDFPDKRTAIQELVSFLKQANLPLFTYLVDSGNGVHVYWKFSADVEVDTWWETGKQLKGVTQALNFPADPVVTGDRARVMRPVGTYNRKNPDEAKRVALIKDTGRVLAFDVWADAVRKAADTHEVKDTAPAPRKRSKNKMLSGDAAKDDVPVDALKVAEQCPTIASMKATQGAEQQEPLWKACLGLLRYTEQGDAICHEWSRGHHGYSEEGTDAKIASHRLAEIGPTTCKHMRTLPGNKCQGCEQKCNTPLVLGYPEGSREIVEEVETPEGDTIQNRIPPMPKGMEMYQFTSSGGLTMSVKDDEGEAKQKKICSAFPTIDYTFIDDDGNHWVHMSTRIRPGVWENSEISVGSMASGGMTLAKEMGSKAGIVSENPTALGNFMRTWYDKLRQGNDLMVMRQQLGWHGEVFVLGKDTIKPDGTVGPTSLSNRLVQYAEAHTPTGSKAKQIDLLNALYNRPGMEHYQFVMAAALGSVLLHLVHHDYVGVPISLWESDGGQGKTTACTVGIALWGDYKAFGQRAHANKITNYARYEVPAIRQHLPLLYDETTSWTGKDLADFAYAYSDGQPKIQGRAEGGIRDARHKTWQNFMFLTANSSLVDKMHQELKNCGPQIARVFEIQIPSDKGKKDADKLLHAEDAGLVDELLKHTGHIGREFITYVVQNRDSIKQLLKAVRTKLQAVDPSPDARYWIMTAACVLVANKLATDKMGLFHWDHKNLMTWVKAQIKMQRRRQVDAEQDAAGVLDGLMLHLEGKVLVTDVWGDNRSKQRAMIDSNWRPRGGVVQARYVSTTTELAIPLSVIADLASTWNTSKSQILGLFGAEGWIYKPSEKLILTRGTTLEGSRSQIRCVVLKIPPEQLLGDEDEVTDDEADGA